MFNKIVTDGVIVFENYQWNEKKQIVSKLTGKILKGDKSQNYCNYQFIQKDRKFRRERNVLLKASFPQMFQPEHKELYMDVFGYEDKYCFRIDNPNIIWSKTRRDFIQIKESKYGHLFFTPSNSNKKWNTENKPIHVMVWQSFNQKKYNGKKMNIHHISFDKSQNQYSNLLYMTSKDHHSFHNLCQIYTGKKRYAWGREYTKDLQMKQFIKIINTYKLSAQDKQRLITSLNLLKI